MKTIYNPLDDAISIKQAITKPRNLNNLINIIAHRSNAYRQDILRNYFAKFQINLLEDLKSELSGNFKETAVSLFYTPLDFDCYQLYKAMKGLGTNEDTLIEILASRSNERINQIKHRYSEMYNQDLTKDIEKDTSGSFRKILIKLLEANRPTNVTPNEQLCGDSAKNLYDASFLKKDNSHDIFIYIFTLKSREELYLISKIYYNWYSKTLLELIDSLFSGNFRRTLKAIIYSLLSPSEYFAYRIHKAVNGLGTKDTILIRVIVSRDEIDIGRIKRYYKQLYRLDLYDVVKNDTSGDYKNLLLELVGS